MPRPTLHATASLLPLLYWCAEIHAAQAIEELLVTATRQETGSMEAPYTIRTLSGEELRQRQVRSLPEALAQTPGVLVQKTSNGQGSPFIRGFTGYRTLALIDGVRYNNGVYRDGPNEYFSLIDAHSLDRVELLSGPSSGLYGSDAIGGALNLHSKATRYQQQEDQKHYQQGSQSYRYASAEDSHISRTEWETGKGGLWGLRLGYSHKDFGNVDAADLGDLPHTGYREDSYDVRYDQQLGDQWQLNVLHQNLTQDDVWRTHSTVYSVPFSGTEVGSDQLRLKDQNRRLSYVKLIGDAPLRGVDSATVTLSQQQWREDGKRTKDNDEHIRQGFESTMRGLDLALSSSTENIDWRYGFDYYRDSINSWRTDYHADGNIDQVRVQGPIGDDSHYTQWGIYGQADWQLGQHQVLLSSRYSRIKAEVGRFLDPETDTAASFSDQWSHWTQALRYSYDFYAAGSQRMIWAGISQSFRAPNIGDLSRFGKSRSDETEVAATDLDPEQFLTFELGIKWAIGHNSIEASYYRTDITDFIASTPTGRIVGGLTEVSKQNAASGYIEGIEISLKHRLTDTLQLSLNGTWLEGELDKVEPGSSQGEQENYSRIMPPQVNLILDWQPDDFDGGIQLIASHANKANKLSSGDASDTQRIPPGGTPSYNLLHLRTHYRVNEKLQLNLTLENVFDETYRNHGSGSNEPGRNLVIGFNYDL